MRVLSVTHHRPAHPVEFRAGAHIDEAGAWIQLQELERLGGRQRAGVGQVVLGAPFVGLGVQLFERAHGSKSPLNSVGPKDHSSAADVSRVIGPSGRCTAQPTGDMLNNGAKNNFCTKMERSGGMPRRIAQTWCFRRATDDATAMPSVRQFPVRARQDGLLRRVGAYMAQKLLYTARSIRPPAFSSDLRVRVDVRGRVS